MKLSKKAVLLFLLFIICLTCSVGASSWIIMSQAIFGVESVSMQLSCESGYSLYEGQFPPLLVEGMSANEIAGTWEITANEDSASQDVFYYKGTTKEGQVVTYSVSFKPSNTKLYKGFENQTVTATVRAVAYIADGPGATSGTYYGTVEKAINAAQNGDYVYVCESYSDYRTATNMSENSTSLLNYQSLSALTIQNDTTIQSGVTLVLPCVEDEAISQSKTDDELAETTDYNYVKQLTQIQTDKNTADYLNSRKLMHNLSIKSGVTLKNEGTIQIGGTVNAGAAGETLNSFTSGEYGQITLNDDAALINDGNIECYGFIAESSLNNGSKLTMNTGTMTVIFSVVEQYGGSAYFGLIDPENKTVNSAISSAALAGLSGTPGEFTPDSLKTMPFNRFYFEGVSCALTVKAEAAVKGYLYLYADNKHNCASVSLIGSENSGSLITLNKSTSRLEIKFNPAATVHNLHIFGDMQLNPFSLSLTVSKSVTSIKVILSSKDVHLALSNYFNITFHPLDKNTTANVDLSKQKVKLLPGATVTIEEGVNVTANSIAVYNTNELLQIYATEYESIGYTNNIPAQLNVKGSLTVDTVGGTITPAGNKAQLTINNGNSVISHEVNDMMQNQSVDIKVLGLVPIPMGYTAVTYYPDADSTYTANGMLMKGITAENSTLSSGITYSSNGSAWFASAFTITFNANGGTFEGGANRINENVEITDGYHLSNKYVPTREYHTFEGWYYDLSLTNKAEIGDILYAATTLYAKWSPITYTVEFNVLQAGVADIPSETITYTADKGGQALPTPSAVEGYNFAGWYADANYTIPVDTYNEAFNYVNANNSVTLYAKWASGYTVNFNVNNSEYAAAIESISFESFEDINGTDKTVPSLTKNDLEVGKSKYFVGWNTQADGSGTAITDWSFISEDTTEYTLYAQWAYKYQLTLKSVHPKYNSLNMEETLWLHPNQFNYVLPAVTQYLSNPTQYDNTITEQYYYGGGWSKDGATIITSIQATDFTDKQLTLSVLWSTKVKVSVVSAKGSDGWSSDGSWPTYTIQFSSDQSNAYYASASITDSSETTREYWIITGHYIRATNTSKISDNPISSWTQVNTATTYTIVGSNGSCIVAGTLITLADGTQKRVEDLTTEDQLLIFNHETGKYEVGYMWFNDTEEISTYRIINLVFSDGTIVKVVYKHGFFDITLNKYVAITESNYNEFIGHKFYTTTWNGQEFIAGEVTLSNVYVTTEHVKVYSPITVYHFNYFTENLLSMPSMNFDMDEVVNVFEFDKNMKYDEEKMQADIAKYGLFTYEELQDYIPYEVYELTPIKYWKIAIEKGLITFEDIIKTAELLREKGVM